MEGSRRLSWEYADGPVVGQEVPITNEARAEESPGVPLTDGADTEGTDSDRTDSDGATTSVEERAVEAADPGLSPEMNERLTHELREVVGSDEVRVPADRPRASRGEHPQQHGLVAEMNMHRFWIIRSAAIVLTFAAIVALATGYWWLLPLAAGAHALGTMTVALTIIRMTTTTEHPSPEVAAAMAEEGVSNPDEHFSRMVEEFRAEPERGAGEVLSPGFNERTAEAATDPATASTEQSSAMTPTAGPSEPAGEGGMPDLLVWATSASLLGVSLLVPAATGGGWMWLLPAVMVPLLVGWVVLQRMMVTRRGEVHLQGRRPMIAIVLCTAAAVAIFCGVIALAFQH